MSSYTRFTLTATDETPLPTIEELTPLWDEALVYGPSWSRVGSLPDELEQAEEKDLGYAGISFTLESKYGYPGIESFGRRVSETWPTAQVEVYEECDSEGYSGFDLTFTGGREVSRSVLEWRNVDPIN